MDDKHNFLLSTLQDLWDGDTQELSLSFDGLARIFSHPVFPHDLLSTLYSLRPLVDTIPSYAVFSHHMEAVYLPHYQEVTAPDLPLDLLLLRRLSIYHPHRVGEGDILGLIDGVKNLNTMAVALFSSDSTLSPEGTLQSWIEGYQSTPQPELQPMELPPVCTPSITYDRYEMMSMFLCPHRYFLDYVLSPAPIVEENHQYEACYETLLIHGAWQRLAGQATAYATSQLTTILGQLSQLYAPYFPLWSPSIFSDLEGRASRYLEQSILGKGSASTVREYAPSHMSMLHLFGQASFSVDFSSYEPTHPYASFEGLSKRRKTSKLYSLHALPKVPRSQVDTATIGALREESAQYLTQSTDTAIPSIWCKACPHQGQCRA